MGHYGYAIDSEKYLAHHGIKGQKWGVRKSRDNYKSLGVSKRLRSTASNLKSFAKSKRGRRVLAAGIGTAAGIGAAAGIAGTIAGKRIKNKSNNGSYQEINDNRYLLPYNNHDQYNPYKQRNKNIYGQGKNLPAIR